ncbi:MAG: CDP-alcohol phosphatidyltransferase family protein [Thiohalocapsa sp.]
MMRPLELSDLPNVISTLRLVAVVPVIHLLVSERYGWALLVFLIAGISDGVDGFLAKHYGWQTSLGGILDPLADKALLISCYLVLGTMGLIPLWLTLAVLFRDLVIVSGGVLYHHLIEDVQATPTRLSKLNTVVQIVLVVAVIADAGPLPLPPILLETLIWSCLATTVLSGLLYVLLWSIMAFRKGPRQQP